MTVVKVIEVIAEGKNIEDAVNKAVAEACKTLHNLKQVNVEHIEALVENNKVVNYRIRTKISFVVDNSNK
ncbi:hypothetical protein BN1013_00566 [Candidatus Rubidus massiliensis]|nr:MAG: hypothetical protein BGO10_03630 [Chlamydia sp. 32-24]CDZ80061.1 hypothetical protein BN1013_00566 [Candidatus Rubidus massiliensis]